MMTRRGGSGLAVWGGGVGAYLLPPQSKAKAACPYDLIIKINAKH